MSETATELRTLLANLVRAALMSDDRASALWREAARQGQARLGADRAGLAGLNIEGFWTLAVREAEAPEHREAEAQVEFGFPALCPFTLAELTAPGFEVDAAVERLRKSAATG
ncbi:hypothetical protein ASF49_12065 [Methylobacterium sp. Leaf104]|uniref:hypothetical protein n=1 Tax=Methylobacterium TaxID=407 RepID=UPI0006FC1E6C|nr:MULTISPECIES: hypothetical protein [Methylobacterium]KQP31284.1 hypothetical protein ASF49_12065 [Methylobacterium sp. Leaf104]MCI9881394.1 hypothetical protein [Methylobacterium goesingense]